MHSLKNNKKSKQCIVLLFLLLALLPLLFTSTIVAADKTEEKKPDKTSPTYCPLCNENHSEINELDFFSRAVYDMDVTVYSGQIFSNEISKADKGITAIEVLEFDRNNAAFDDLWNKTAKGFYNVFKPIGIMLAVVYCLAEILSRFSKDSLNDEYFAKELIKLTAAVIVVLNGFEIISAVLDVGATMFNSVNTCEYEFRNNSANCIIANGTYDDLIAAIGMMLTLAIPYIVMLVAKAVVSITCWARILELIARVIFAPIGLSDLVVKGTGSNGVRYLKKILVTMSQAAVIGAFVKAYSVIISSLGIGVGAWFLQCMLAIILVSAIGKAKQVASDVIGV